MSRCTDCPIARCSASRADWQSWRGCGRMLGEAKLGCTKLLHHRQVILIGVFGDHAALTVEREDVTEHEGDSSARCFDTTPCTGVRLRDPPLNKDGAI